MPKATRAQSALKKTRNLLSSLSHNNCETSDSEDSISSIESGDLAHIPIKSTPSFDNLSLNDSDTMEEIGATLQKMMQMMDQFAAKQKEHDTMFTQIEAHINNRAPATEPVAQPTASFEQLFRIPDSIKLLPVLDGNSRRQLNGWLTTAEQTLNTFKDYVTPVQFKMYVTAVTNKIQGRAKDIVCLAGNPDDFDIIKEVLINALGDRQELSTYKCQLWQCKMTEGMSIARYYHRSKEIIENIKTLAKQKEKYRDNWNVINDFIEEDALAAFIAGLSEPYFGYAQAAKPSDMEDAYAFLCKFKSREIAAHSIASNSATKKFQKHKHFEPKSNKPPKSEYQKIDRPESEPMDATTTRSRLTVNKRTLNNHETTNHDREDEISEDSDIETDLDLNFHLEDTSSKPA